MNNTQYKVLSTEEWEAYTQQALISNPTMTVAQECVTKAEDCNILVAAAAGSGKTWVLVQRILRTLLEKQVDIDRFLIVTFTKAAAAEMRERIGKAIQKELLECQQKAANGEQNLSKQISFLQRQATLIYQAKISTIDSFCGDVVKQYFMKINVDPNYRIADEGELKLIRAEAMKNVLEEAYALSKARLDELNQEENSRNKVVQSDEISQDISLSIPFYHLLACYAPGKNDTKIEELIYKLYDFQMSHPDPDEWIDTAQKYISQNDIWFQLLMEHCQVLFEEIKPFIAHAKSFAESITSEDKVIEVFDADMDYVNQLCAASKKKANANSQSFVDCYTAIKNVYEAHGKFATLYKKELDKEEGDKLQKLREAYKKKINKIEKDYFGNTSSVLCNEREYVKGDMEELLRLSQEFRKEYENLKREKSIADFSDVEHMALQILTKKSESGDLVPSDVAETLKQEYFEIMIDEYQDSNFLQEAILSSFASQNMFMVGDMKQSIYRFRMARPELFVGKYKTFTPYEDAKPKEDVVIELDSNFRSSSNVLESINYIFAQIMHQYAGDVEYDEKAALKYGAKFESPVLCENAWPELKDNKEGYFYNNTTELLVYDESETLEEEHEVSDDKITDTPSAKLEENGKVDAGVSRIEQEAKMVAIRIQELMSNEHRMLVKDASVAKEDAAQYRPIQYRDIVILLRATSEYAAVFQRILSQAGIPVYVESNKGYFSSMEIQTILSYLQILNNATNDIAMTAVLHSYFGGFSAEELAELVCCTKHLHPQNMYDRIRYVYRKDEKNVSESTEKEPIIIECSDMLYHKVKCFMEQYLEILKSITELPVNELIQMILLKSGFRDYVQALPAGERKVANLDMLIQKAKAYEKTSYRGLFWFVRYIEKLHSYDVDYGEANLLSENEDVVRIMSIHKSKGLEFPVVFVSTLGKMFNDRDSKADILLHAELGVGPKIIDPLLRTKHSSIMRTVLGILSKKDMLGEELRVLYVAMTRAKDKCILTGAVKDWEEEFTNLESVCNYSSIMSSRTFLHWILMALLHHPVFQEERRRYGMSDVQQVDEYKDCDYSFSLLHASDLTKKYMTCGIMEEDQYEKIMLNSYAVTEGERMAVKNNIEWQYPDAWKTKQPVKYSVSQIKKHQIDQNKDNDSQDTSKSHWCSATTLVPSFIAKEKPKVTAAQRGTDIHKFMQLYDFEKGYSEAEYQRVCELMHKRGCSEIEVEFPIELLKTFFESTIAQKMVSAQKEQLLHKEAQFVVGLPADEVLQDMGTVLNHNSKERIMIQGIIDAYIETEDGNLVIMDYKTDHVKSMEELAKRYRVQLVYYKKTLEQLTGKKVTDMVIYSFELHQEINVN